VGEAMIPILTFVIIFTSVFGAYWVFVQRPEAQTVHVVKQRLKNPRPKLIKGPDLRREVQELSSIAQFDALLRRGRSYTASLQLLLEQSGVKTTVGQLVLVCAVLAVVAAFVTYRLTGLVLLALPAAGLAAWVPIAVVRYKRTVRMRKFEEQFPEALDLLGRAMRAGHAFTTGVEMVATEMPAPLGPEFRILYDQQNYGMPLPDALRLFAERISVLDARFFVTAVLIQRESGGNLSEILDNLAGVMRERFRVKRQIRVLSAHGRISGWVLVCMPPALALVLFTINQEHRDLMFHDPLGQKMVITAATLQVVGTLIMRKIINIQY
jgi:tight adherence protein B